MHKSPMKNVSAYILKQSRGLLKPVYGIIKKFIIGHAETVFRHPMPPAPAPADGCVFTVPAVFMHPGRFLDKADFFSFFINPVKRDFVQTAKPVSVQHIKIAGVDFPVRLHHMLTGAYAVHTADVRRHQQEHLDIFLKLLYVYDNPAFQIVIPQVEKRFQKMPVGFWRKRIRKPLLFPRDRIQAGDELQQSFLLPVRQPGSGHV